MDKTLEDVSPEAVSKAMEIAKKKTSKGSRYQVVRLAKEAGPSASKRISEITAESAEDAEVLRVNQDDDDSGTETTDQDVSEAMSCTGGFAGQLREDSLARAAECFQVFRIQPEAVVVHWKLAKVDDGLAPVLGGVCKELLRQTEAKKIFFDFSAVDELSTVAIGTTVRFKNTAVRLDKEVYVIAGPKLRDNLREAYLDRILDIHENIYGFLAVEIQFTESRHLPERGQKRFWRRAWKRFIRSIVFWMQLPRLLRMRRFLPICASAFLFVTSVIGQPSFPSLAELEMLLSEAPDLQVLEVEIKQEKLRRSWWNRITLRANYSQHFSSAVPFVPTPDLAVAGGTFVGASVAIPLGELLRKQTPQDLELRLKELEYRHLYQRKLAELKSMYRQREKLMVQLEAIEAEKKTAELKLQRVRIGLQLMQEMTDSSFVFDPIDLAQAEEELARVVSEKRRAGLNVQILEAEIFGLLGKGDCQEVNVFIVLLIAALFLIVTAPQIRRKRIIANFDPGKPQTKSAKPKAQKEPENEGIRLGNGVYWSPTRHPNPHVLIVGGSGSGKTWTIRLLAGELLKSGYPSVLFDFHGDLGVSEAVTHRISLDSQYGVNPLALSLDPTGGGPDPQRFEVLEQLRNAFKPMGSLQLALLDDCLKSTYRRFGVNQENPETWSQVRMPHLGDLQSELDRRIEKDPKNLRAKGLRTKLSLAFDFRIFSKPQVPLPVSHPESRVPGCQVSRIEGPACGTHIDMSKLPPQLQFMTADSLLKQIFRQQQLSGIKPLSLYLLLDESKLCTPQNKDSPLAALNRIATEGRKFGIGLIVSSQYVGHLPRDVVVNTFTKLLMKTDKTEVAATARRFKVEETQLLCLQEPGQALINFASDFGWKELQVGH